MKFMIRGISYIPEERKKKVTWRKKNTSEKSSNQRYPYFFATRNVKFEVMKDSP